MQPTAEQIAAMEERGWAWNAGNTAFVAVAVVGYDYRIALRVWWWHDEEGGWVADYGWTGVSFASYSTRFADPLAAADEAEAWLRGVLSGFRFPWLMVIP